MTFTRRTQTRVLETQCAPLFLSKSHFFQNDRPAPRVKHGTQLLCVPAAAAVFAIAAATAVRCEPTAAMQLKVTASDASPAKRSIVSSGEALNAKAVNTDNVSALV